MPAPVAVYVVAAIAGVAAVIAFKEFVFEPHIAPAIDRWAEDWIEKRRARRRARAVSIPVSSTRGPGDGDNRHSTGSDARKRTPAGEDHIELDGLNLDEWRNDVHRSVPGTGVRRRPRVVPDTDEGSISTTIDESFTTLTHTPLAPTHVISNISSPFTDVLSISMPAPGRSRTHSGSSSRTVGEDERPSSTTVFFASPSTSSSAPPSPPFGPILPDTPRTSAAYSSRPFSPVVRTPVRSRAPSSGSSLHHSSSGSRLSVNVQGSRVAVDFEGDHVNLNINGDGNASVHGSASRGMSANASFVGSLSERYPAMPSPPILLSPPSPNTVLSSPSSDVLSLGSSSGNRSDSPFDVVSPPLYFGALHPPALHTSRSAAASEDEFMSFGEVSDADRGVMPAPRRTHMHNPFSGSDDGSEFESGSETSESGSEGSWGRVTHGTGRR